MNDTPDQPMTYSWGNDPINVVFDGRAAELEGWIVGPFDPTDGSFDADHASGLRIRVHRLDRLSDGSFEAGEVSVSREGERGVDSAALNSIPLSSLVSNVLVFDRTQSYKPNTPEGEPAHSSKEWRDRLTADVQFLREVGASVAKSVAATHFDGDLKTARAWIRYLQRQGRL